MSFLFWTAMAMCVWGGQALQDHPVVTAQGSDEPAKARVIISQAGEDPSRMVIVQAAPQIVLRAQAGPEGEEKVMALQKVPSQWIGVRITPVPKPLAAHIGPAGVMIVNVVKGSPADESGLEQYDVVIGFDRQKVDDTEDLLTAIGDIEADTRTEIVVIRSGKKERLSITPVKRPESFDVEYKYEEPEQEVTDQSLNLRGHRLKMVPGGEWILEELGPMRQIPEVLKKLELDLKGLDLDFDPEDFDPDAFDIDVRILRDPQDWLEFHEPGDTEARIEITMEIDDDGNVTSIHREADGTIHIERTDPDGGESSATYDSIEEFKQEDPEGYKLYRRHSGHGGHSWIHVRPHAKQLKKLQHKFQFQIQDQLQDVREHVKEAHKKADAAAKKARKRVKTMVQKRAAEEPSAQGTLSVQIDDDGAITVTTYKAGRRTKYNFDSKEEFQRSAPELYEKVKSLFE